MSSPPPTRAAHRALAVDAVVEACRLAREVAANLDGERAHLKSDASPVTVADFAVQALIAHRLRHALGDVALVAEESADAVRGDGALAGRVLAHVQRHVPSLSEPQLLELLDRGRHPGGTGPFWTLDPIDGTKGFLRGEQYAIALAWVDGGDVQLGVLGCPNLPASGERGCIAIAAAGHGATLRGIADPTERPIRVSAIADPSRAAFCESVEAAHSSHDAAARIAAQLGITAPAVRMDSQCKYVAVARGDAEIYLRLPTRAGYEENLWDHAAGALLVREAGGRLTDVLGRPLAFSLGRTLRGNRGVIATNGALHDAVLAATRPLFEPTA
ncbi:MAG TPA: 3'(2'),5'-bisphosphate nucleotidase [Kofleriaceae bacterium]|nr:3'(2'),5'-bisphosphate nucleotidase [Kofleriaceae bacterium]